MGLFDWMFKSEEEKKLEELRAEEARILKSNEKYGEGAIELNKENLKNSAGIIEKEMENAIKHLEKMLNKYFGGQ